MVVDVPDYYIVVFELRKGLAKSEIISNFTLDLSLYGSWFWPIQGTVVGRVEGHVAKNRKSDAYLFLKLAK